MIVSDRRNFSWSDIWLYDNLDWDVKHVAHYIEQIDWEVCSLSRPFLSKTGILDNYINLFKNKNLAWPLDEENTILFIERHQYSIDWCLLSSFIYLPWSKKLIAQFEEYWNYDVLFQNEGLPWHSESIFEYYKSKIDKFEIVKTRAVITEKQFEAILIQTSLGLTSHLLEIKDSIDSSYISGAVHLFYESKNNLWAFLSNLTLSEWRTSLIQKYTDLWNWQNLSANPSIKWHERDISLFADKLDLCRMLLSEPNHIWDARVLLPLLDNFPWQSSDFYALVNWSVDVLERYEHCVNWSSLSRYGYLTPEILSVFIEKIDWEALSFNHNTVISDELYQQFYARWPVQILSNPNIKFEEKDFIRFKTAFEQIAKKETKDHVIVKHGYRNPKNKFYIPNIIWSNAVLKIIYTALDGPSLAQNANVSWTLDKLMIVQDKEQFYGCSFELCNLDFIDINYLKQFER